MDNKPTVQIVRVQYTCDVRMNNLERFVPNNRNQNSIYLKLNWDFNPKHFQLSDQLRTLFGQDNISFFGFKSWMKII